MRDRRLHHLEPRLRRRQSGELRHARVQHADNTPPQRFAWRKTPIATSVERAAVAGGPGWGAGGCRKPGNCTRGRCHGETNFAQQEPRRTASVQNSPSTPLLTACAVQNSPCSPEMARFGALSACRESFVPLSPPRSRAGRILYRTRGRVGARQHNSTPGPTGLEDVRGAGVEGTGETGGHRGVATRRAWPDNEWVIGHFVLLGLVPGVVVGGGVVEFVEADCVAPAGDGAGGLVGLTGLVPSIFEGCVGGHGRQDHRCWLRVS